MKIAGQNFVEKFLIKKISLNVSDCGLRLEVSLEPTKRIAEQFEKE